MRPRSTELSPVREVVAETDARQQDDTITDIEVHLNEKDSEQLFDSSHASMLQDDQQIPDMFLVLLVLWGPPLIQLHHRHICQGTFIPSLLVKVSTAILSCGLLLFPCVLYLLCVGLPVFFNAMHQHREPSPNAIRGALRAHGKGPFY